MTQGYRSMMGIAVAQSCETALYYYQKAAKKGILPTNITVQTLAVSGGSSILAI